MDIDIKKRFEEEINLNRPKKRQKSISSFNNSSPLQQQKYKRQSFDQRHTIVFVRNG